MLSLLRLEAVWVFLPLTFLFATIASQPIAGDTWWTITMGRFIQQSWTLPTSYPFTFAPQSVRFVDAQWLGQLIYFLPYPLLGLGGVALLNAVIVTATFGIILVAAWRASHSVAAAAAATGLGAFVAVSNSSPRAQTLGFFLFAISYWVLGPPAASWEPSARRAVWSIAGLFAVEVCWANIHGSFFLGPFLTGLLLVGSLIEHANLIHVTDWLGTSRVRFLLAVIVAQTVATLVTPERLALYDYVVRLSTNPEIRSSVTEWQATTFSTSTGVVFFLSLPIVVLVMARSPRRVALSDLVVLVPFGLLGVSAVRNVAWWGLALAPVLAPYLAGFRLWSPSRELSSAALPRYQLTMNATTLLVLVAIATMSLPWTKDVNPLTPEEKRGLVDQSEPQGAVRFLAQRGSCAHTFTAQRWGAYVNWMLGPGCRAFLDGPVEVYAADSWSAYVAISAGRREWEELLRTYRVDVLMVDRAEQHTLLDQAEKSGQWREIYRDEKAVLFEPRRPQLE